MFDHFSVLNFSAFIYLQEKMMAGVWVTDVK
jgi:hypothetical protein